jgi:hypothetical protein
MAALVYQAMPYYVVDLYSRAALGEYISFAWLPFVFLFAYQCITKRGLLDCVLLAFTIGGLVLTHILTAYMAAFALGLYRNRTDFNFPGKHDERRGCAVEHRPGHHNRGDSLPELARIPVGTATNRAGDDIGLCVQHVHVVQPFESVVDDPAVRWRIYGAASDLIWQHN